MLYHFKAFSDELSFRTISHQQSARFLISFTEAAFAQIAMNLLLSFFRYKITPVCDIDFGPLTYGCKKSLSFTITNNGIFETRYSICRSGTVSSLTLTGKPG